MKLCQSLHRNLVRYGFISLINKYIYSVFQLVTCHISDFLRGQCGLTVYILSAQPYTLSCSDEGLTHSLFYSLHQGRSTLVLTGTSIPYIWQCAYQFASLSVCLCQPVPHSLTHSLTHPPTHSVCLSACFSVCPSAHLPSLSIYLSFWCSISPVCLSACLFLPFVFFPNSFLFPLFVSQVYFWGGGKQTPQKVDNFEGGTCALQVSLHAWNVSSCFYG